MTGFLFVAIIVGFIALTAVKLAPTYMEYRSIKQAMDAAVSQTGGAKEGSAKDIRESISKRLSMNYVTSVKSSDIQVSKSERGYRASVDYQAEKPYVGNVFLVVKFKYETETK